MLFEVEQKFQVDDLGLIASKVMRCGAEVSSPREEVDLYFAHPARDFAVTDEALRIRRTDAAAYITYKGPKIDASTKTRREIDLPLGLPSEQADLWREMLEALGFQPVAQVRKRRRKAFVACQGRRVEVSLDEVESVGTYVELELIASAAEMQSARECIAELASQLGLSVSERRSYLELLLEKSVGQRTRNEVPTR